MTRIKLSVNQDALENNQPKNELDELVPEFGKKNDTVKALKKETEILGEKIKELMSVDNNTYIAGDYKARYVEKETSKLNEDALLVRLSKDEFREEADALELIQVKEYVNMDALENALYHEKVSAELLEQIKACTTVKITPSLTVTKMKGKK